MNSSPPPVIIIIILLMVAKIRVSFFTVSCVPVSKVYHRYTRDSEKLIDARTRFSKRCSYFQTIFKQNECTVACNISTFCICARKLKIKWTVTRNESEIFTLCITFLQFVSKRKQLAAYPMKLKCNCAYKQKYVQKSA